MKLNSRLLKNIPILLIVSAAKRERGSTLKLKIVTKLFIMLLLKSKSKNCFEADEKKS